MPCFSAEDINNQVQIPASGSVRHPLMRVNLAKITRNAEIVAGLCRRAGMGVMGVTKAFCAEPAIARAMIRGGLDWLGDSRIQNIARLKEAGIETPICLLRLPMISEAREVAALADMSLVSEVETAKALSEAAASQGRTHKITLMVDLGDLREGLLPQNILQAAKIINEMPGVELYGLGVNFACYGGVIPTTEKLEALLALAEDIRRQTGLPLPIVSGGNSASLYLAPGGIPNGVTNLRIGEAILLGRETSYRKVIEGAFTDTFTLECEIIELQKKPSLPDGLIGTNAFGQKPVFVDKGIRKRAILAIGRHDVIIDGLVPVDPKAEIIGASSDHLLMDVTEVERPLSVGSLMEFNVQYGSLISAMMSPYVTKIIG
ncbi:alanine racemase [Deltaproteobacteria bacterium Smac51]|nr:alanine racemase [Deltaproteobacteria bacterium Smac51]